MTPTALTIKGHNLLTHSRMRAFRTCPRLHQFKYEFGIRRQRSDDALSFGSVMHSALEGVLANAPIVDVVASVAAAFSTYPAWCDSDEDRIRHEDHGCMAQAMIEGYAAYWSVPRDNAPRIAKVLEIEKAFQVPIVSPYSGRAIRKFRAAGKIDAIVELADGRVAVMEHKTTQDDISPGSDYWPVLEIDQQISLYMVAARQLGYTIDTIIYDVLRKPRHRRSQVPLVDDEGIKIVVDANGERVKNQNGKWRQSADSANGLILMTQPETPVQFYDRIAHEIANEPASYFCRREIPRLESDIEDFRHELVQQAQAISDARNAGRWYRNTAACTGRSQCEFLGVCRNGIDPSNPPSGFERLTNLHPELTE